MNRRFFACKNAQRGVTLITTLLILLAVLLLGMAAAQIALLSEKSSRNDRDRQIAFQAAEAALLDAEMDIENSPDAAKSRSHLFSNTSALGFPNEDTATCGSGEQSPYLGLCSHSPAGTAPVWHLIDFMDDAPGSVNSVPYGRFTGQLFPTTHGFLPSRVPRYIIELMHHAKAGERADEVRYFYRITAVGFGASETTQIALQTVYRKAGR